MTEQELDKKFLENYSNYLNEVNEKAIEMNDVFEDAIDQTEGNDEVQGRIMFLKSHFNSLMQDARGNYNNNLYLILKETQEEPITQTRRLTEWLKNFKNWQKNLITKMTGA